MRKALFIWGCAMALAGSGAFAAPTTVVTVIGQNDPAIDRQAIQDAIDAAAPDSTIRLLGVFQLDGERILIHGSGLSIVGEAIDDDGDGRIQEDWSDGRDNDGDGLVDEDGWETVVHGVAGPGGPATDDGVNGFFNRGLVIDGAVPAVEDLVIRDIHFTTFQRAIDLIPEWASPTGRCDDRVRVAGSARRVTVERNLFTDNILGVVMLGDVSASEIRDNVFERNSTFGAVVEGNADDCPLSGGGSVLLDLGTPHSVALRGNLAVESSLATAYTEQSTVDANRFEGTVFGYLSLDDVAATIRNNTMTDNLVGAVLFGGEQLRFEANTVIRPVIGFDLYEAADHVQFVNNHLVDAYVGIWMEDGASGFRSIENRFEGSSVVNVFLDTGSSDNLVVNDASEPISVVDLGNGNRLVGSFVPPAL